MKKTLRRILCFVLAFAMVSALTLNGAYAADSFFKVKASELCLRAEPSLSSEKIEILKTNAVLLRLDTTATDADGYLWYHVRVVASGNEGYVAAKYITATEAPDGYYVEDGTEETNHGYLKVTAKLLNMRKSASSSADVVLVLEEGTILIKTAEDKITAEETEWYVVKVQATGEEGYIMAEYAEEYAYNDAETTE
ncbi:MAG: SH3 domain-containing protein, partial [Christensenellaceae bacterium]|nr:SH3 domain-containing protein [Christensenellaceae bacterium]